MEAAVFDVNGIKSYQFNVKDSEIVAYHMCLGNISKDFTNDNIKKIALNGYVYNFSVSYNAADKCNIINIHKYLMVKNDIK